MNEPMTRLQSLYDEHGPSLLRYLRRLTGQRESAEDLLQETFVQALKSNSKFEAVTLPRAWLFTIARHLGLNAIRGRRQIALLGDDVASPEAESEDPRREALRRAIAELPPDQRETLQLRLRDELSYLEIARVLGIPVGTVRSRLHLAVKRLRSAMIEE